MMLAKPRKTNLEAIPICGFYGRCPLPAPGTAALAQDRGMSTRKLAHPATLIFDGDCGFCTTAVLWLQRTLPRVPATAPFQWTDLADFGLTEDEARSQVWFVTAGNRYGGAAAVAAVLRGQPSPLLRALGWLGTVPPWSWVADAGYRVVARYRYRLPGGTPACRLPSAP
jgi:predicted DCC family thiol-disulfide oxidoreductase YuxK